MAIGWSIGRRAAFALSLFFACDIAAAQNLVVNGGFAGNLAGWTMQPAGAATYSVEDIDLLPGSGSVLLTTNVGMAGVLVYPLKQCVSLPAIGIYEIGASGRLSSGVQAADLLNLTVQAWDSSDCTGAFRSGSSATIAPLPAWRAVSATLTVKTLPASIEILLGIEKAAAAGSASGRFDRVYLIAGEDDIFTDQFE